MGAAARLHAQEVLRDEYLRFMPLRQPRAVARTDASRRLHLYGDRDAPGYADEAPRDGIDDRRGERLHALAVRFAPYMVRNTSSAPLDFRTFIQSPSTSPLHVDTWDISRPGAELVQSRTVNLGAHGTREDDEALLQLLRDFDPRAPADPGTRASVRSPEPEFFRVLFFDFPGQDPASWKEAYENRISGQLPRGFEEFRRAYVHPFIREVSARGTPVYEFVLQYWFFYPFNDGGNNHEGDWEHINVVLTSEGKGTTRLSAPEIRGILGSPDAESVSVETLRLGRVEYYFHEKVMTLDFLEPDVYLPHSEWQQALEEMSEERRGERHIWRTIREMAYADPDESAINTHPIVYIGGDNKGADQLLHPPGGANRDSHGSYPFPGLYKNIGPAAAAEAISGAWNPHHDVHRPDRTASSRLVRFDRADRLELLPDWERVVDLVLDDPGVRREWSWLVLPIRWGYPAVQSPFAGVVTHAETGNLAPVGPAYNSGWNRVGGTAEFTRYEPHRFTSTLPLGWEDSFVNSWGFLNLTLPTMVILPPFDFVWRVALAPVRVPFQARSPTYFPEEAPPSRLLGAGGGVSVSFLPDEFALLLSAPELFDQITAVTGDAEAGAEEVARNVDAAVGPVGWFEFHIGNRLVSINRLRYVPSRLGVDIRIPGEPRVTPVRAGLEIWELSGSLRYNILTGSFQPFGMLGYGLNWFRLRDVTLDGARLDPDGTEWIRRPSLVPFRNVLPNTWHAGAGIETVPIRNFGPFPRGLDVALRISWSVSVHGLSLRRTELLSEQQDVALGRMNLDLGVVITF